MGLDAALRSTFELKTGMRHLNISPVDTPILPDHQAIFEHSFELQI